MSLSRRPGVSGTGRGSSYDPTTFQMLTSGGRYGGLLALPPLFLPFFFFPFGPPQLLLPPAPRALRFPPMAGPPPGRQQPPNSSDTRESIRRCHQPPARPLPPATTAAPTATAASGQPEESGVWPSSGHAPASPGLLIASEKAAGHQGIPSPQGRELVLKNVNPNYNSQEASRREGRRWFRGRVLQALLARKSLREL